MAGAEKSGDLIRALDHLVSALRLLDEAGAPAQIGAHVDLASHQLKDFLKLNADGTLN